MKYYTNYLIKLALMKWKSNEAGIKKVGLPKGMIEISHQDPSDKNKRNIERDL